MMVIAPKHVGDVLM